MKVLLLLLLVAGGAFADSQTPPERISRGTLMRDGVVFPAYAVTGKSYFYGEWLDNPFSSVGEIYSALGLSPDGELPIPDLTQDIADHYIWGGDHLTYEAGAQSLGYPSLAAMLNDAAMGGPYISLQDLYDDWIENGWIDFSVSPPEWLDVPVASLNAIMNDTASLVSAAEQFPNLPPDVVQSIFDSSSWTADGAATMVRKLSELNSESDGVKAALGEMFAMALHSDGLLYPLKSDIDFTNANLRGISLDGANLSGMLLTGAQLNEPHVVPGVFMPGTPSYVGTNFSGLDMTGFLPERVGGLGVLTPDTPQEGYYKTSMAGANFSNTTNLSVDAVKKSSSFDGVNFS